MSTPQFTDLNEAFGKALLQQFFEPMLMGRGQNGEPYYSPSGSSMVADQIYRDHAAKIVEAVWEKIDMDELAEKIATLVVAELIKPPDRWTGKNTHQDKLAERVKEIAAQQLGQRVVDAMDLQLGPKEIEA